MNDRLDRPSSKVWRGTTVALGSAVPAVLSASACQVDEGDSFRVTKIEFDNASKITLTFSQPIAELGDIDPNDFRLSMGQTNSISETYGGVTYTYDYTGYTDLAYVIDGYDYYNPGQRFSFMTVAAGPADNQIVLTTAEPLGPDACIYIDYMLDQFEMYSQYYADMRVDVAMFLHYASGDVPIESEGGGVLEDIGADWVLSESLFDSRMGYGFTNLTPQLRIPCP